MGGHSLLDETVVFFGTELQHPATHSKKNMPFLLAGGGLRTGRWVYLGGPPHNNLLVSLLNLFGDPHDLRRSAVLHRPAAEPGLNPTLLGDGMLGGRGVASSRDDDAPTQGDPPPLTSFSSNPASSVVVAPATNAPATRVRIRWRSARSIRSRFQPLQQSVDDPLPPPRRERRHLRALRHIDQPLDALPTLVVFQTVAGLQVCAPLPR